VKLGETRGLVCSVDGIIRRRTVAVEAENT